MNMVDNNDTAIRRRGLPLSFIRGVWTGRDDWMVLALLAFSLSLNVYFAANKTGRSHVSTVNVGEFVPSLRVSDLKGVQTVVSWNSDSRPVLLYVFAPSCVWCSRNFENIDTLYRKRQGSYRFIGLSRPEPGLQDYVLKHSISYPVYTAVDNGEARLITDTPATFIISKAGRVEEVWHGAWLGRTKRDIETKLAISLPGILPAVQ